MSLWSAFTGILGQGLAIVTGKIGVNVDGTTITVNGSNQLVASGGGGGLTIVGPFEYINTNSLTDYSSNLHYSTGSLLADANGVLYYSNDNIMADGNGYLYYNTGSLMADGSGNLYYSTGNILANAGGTLFYGNNSHLADANGYLYYNTGSLMADGSGNLYYSTGNILANAGGTLFYGNNSHLADGSGYLYYSTGSLLADNSGNLYYSNGNILADGSGRLNATGINFASSQTTINGSTSGSTVSSMPFQGSTYKKVVIYVNALVNATSTSYTFPTAFTKTPAITYVPSGDAALITLSTTVVTFAVGTFVSGFVTIEGY
jgi:hypothetical protein